MTENQGLIIIVMLAVSLALQGAMLLRSLEPFTARLDGPVELQSPMEVTEPSGGLGRPRPLRVQVVGPVEMDIGY